MEPKSCEISLIQSVQNFKHNVCNFELLLNVSFCNPYLYNKTRHSHIYMLPIAAQKTPGPIGQNFFFQIFF